MFVKACLPLFVALLLTLAEGSLLPLDPRYEKGSAVRHVALDEALAEFPQLSRAKRQSTSPFPPVIQGDHEFDDGFRSASIHYSGDNSKVIFVLTYDRDQAGNPVDTNLYRSTDYGASFRQIDNLLDQDSATPEDNPLLWPFFYVNPANKNILVFPHATQAKIFYTQDEGNNWSSRSFIPNTINSRSLVWNPSNPDWAIAHDSQNDHLYVTRDSGANFVKIADYVDQPSDYQWTDPDSEPDGDSSIIYYNTYNPDDQDRGDLSVALYTQRNPYTDATRKEFDKALGKHDDFLLVGPYIFVQQTVEGKIGLLVSHDRKPFQTAMIPSTEGHQNYVVSHINRLQALVIVEHANDQWNLYLSDIDGVYFSLSLPDIVVENGVDLEVIEGINGTMIANQYVRTTADPTMRTLRTLDNGGVWEFISPPDRNIDGFPVTCSPPLCSLHFHMDTSDYARLGVYSQESAPGIIVAHGNTGDRLLENPDLYISRDGGVTWDETLAGSWGVTVADHGGLIVAAKDYHKEPSRQLKYSCNEGGTWDDFDFTVTTMTIYGLITEPGEHTTIVSLYGTKSTTNPIAWDVVTVNFTSIFAYICQDSDYYDWEPWDDRTGEDCILGSEVAIERRLPDRCCLNGRQYDRTVSFEVCLCTDDDFECDYGYMRSDGFTGPCVPDPIIPMVDPCQRPNITSYMKSSGYRKIPADVCKAGVEAEFGAYNFSCCGATDGVTDGVVGGTPSSNVITVALGVLFMLAVLVAIAFAVAAGVFMRKNAIARRTYQRVSVSGTESGGRFRFRSDSPDQTVPLTQPADDDDDAPIMP